MDDVPWSGFIGEGRAAEAVARQPARDACLDGATRAAIMRDMEASEGSGPNWNGRFLDTLARHGYGLMPLAEARRTGLLDDNTSAMLAPMPEPGGENDPRYPFPSVIVPLALLVARGAAV